MRFKPAHVLRVLLSTFLFISPFGYSDIFVQINYSPLGGVHEDEDQFTYGEETYEKYDMTLDYSVGGRVLLDIFYFSYHRSYHDVIDGVPEATLDTYALGLGCLTRYDYSESLETYFLFGLGAGSGEFNFENSTLDDWELLLETNMEVGFIFQRHLTVGAGLEFQHFGSFGESKATSGLAYLSLGLVF